MKINTKLIILSLAISLIPVIIISAISIFESQKTLKDTIGTQYKILANEKSASIDLLIEYLKDETRVLSEMQEVKAFVRKSGSAYSGKTEEEVLTAIKNIDKEWIAAQKPTETAKHILNNNLSMFLKEYQGKNPTKYIEIFVTDTKGATVAMTKKLSDYYQADEVWWTSCFDEGRGRIITEDRGYDKSVDAIVVGIVAPIKAKEEIIGILKINYRVDEILHLIGEASTIQDEHVFILQSVGDSHIHIKGRHLKIPSDLERKLLATNEAGWVEDVHEGRKTIMGYSPINTNFLTRFTGPEAIDEVSGEQWIPTRWGLFIELEQDAVFRPIARLKRFFLFTAAFISIAILFLAHIFAKSISKPIQRLIKDTETIGRGNFEHKIDIKSRDEIGMLSSSFNEMTDKLNKSYKDLQKEIAEHTKAKEVLSEQEKKFRSVVEASTEAIILCDSRGYIIFVNRGFEVMFGYNKEELLGNPITTVMPERYREKHQKGVDRVTATGESHYIGKTLEFEGLRKDVGEFPLELNIATWKTEKGTFYSGIIRDITERKRVEAEILRKGRLLEGINRVLELAIICETEEELGKACLAVTAELTGSKFGFFGEINQDGLFDIIAISNPGWDACDMAVLDARKHLSNMPVRGVDRSIILDGKSRILNGEEAIANHPDHVELPDGHPPLTAFLGVPLKSERRTIGMIGLGNKEGGYTLEDQENIEALATAFVEALASRRAQYAQKKSEKRYRNLVEATTNYIYTVQVENGRPVATSHAPSCIAVTGFSAEEYKADPDLWIRAVYEEDRNMVLNQAAKVLSGEEAPSLEHRIIHKDGSILWVKNTPVPRFDETGELAAYDGMVTDITEQKKLEEQLRHAQKMEAIGQLTGGIAHDFNNILNVIIGFAGIIEMKLLADDPLREHLNEIFKAVERGALLNKSLLAFSRKQIMEPKPVDLNGILRSIEKLLNRVIREDIILKTEFADREIIIMADSAQIVQVLINLATNARDAMPEGGELFIETEALELDNEFIRRHYYGEPGTYALVTITDTGTGMDEATMEKIFEPFFTTKELGKGTGLGLAMAYGIIKQHNGFINVYSEVGKGTTFKIYLPVIKAEVEVMKPAEVTSVRGGTETILVAEDDEALRKFSRTVLEAYGYKVITAEDGEDAIDKFMQNKEKIQLLILDVIMPKKNGREVYEEIKKIKPDIKTLFLSGYTANLIHKKGILGEGFNFIMKPVRTHELLQKVRAVLDK